MVQLAQSAERLLASGAGSGRPAQNRLHYWATTFPRSPGPVGPDGGHPANCRRRSRLPSPLPRPGAQEQERDATLTHVQCWLAAGKRPEWADVAALDTETRAYHSQWASLEARDGVLYRQWWAPGRGADLLQLLVPRALWTQVNWCTAALDRIQTVKTQEMNVLRDQTMALNVELQQRQTEQEKLLAQRDDVSSQLQEVNRANSRLLEQLTGLGQEKDKLQQELEETRKTAEKSALEHQEQLFYSIVIVTFTIPLSP
ncbi:hypothetical protein AAFF_G00185600 [Aldrovandia affinis]|uniref:Uncharacterized protein n=1 Tax=Aldrovandia affinis TaxID=143900 RepID=A0AAD7RJQ6_9TELE|nr:hypothetical protein AAFF_G00185600 [Aldrovandia affinis]